MSKIRKSKFKKEEIVQAIEINKTLTHSAKYLGISSQWLIKLLKRFELRTKYDFSKNHGINPYWKGKYLSIETKHKISISKKGQVPPNKLMRILSICPICNSEYINVPQCKNRSKNKKTCSSKCKNIMTSQTNGGKNNPFYKKTHSIKSKKQMRLSTIKWIEKNKNNGNQIFPRYNRNSISILEQKAKELGITDLQHAENGGEFYIKELGYWADGYSKSKNIWIEIDEKRHQRLKQKEKDIMRQQEIEQFLKCKFIRIKYNLENLNA